MSLTYPFPRRSPDCALVISSLLTESGSGLVDLLIARRRVFGTHLDRGTAVLELEVAAIPVEEETVEAVEAVEVAELEDTYLVLGVAGVSRSLDAHALVGVLAPASDVN